MEANKKLPIMSRIGVIFLTWRRYNEKAAKSNNLTLNQYYILKQLMKRDYLNPSEIAEKLYCDRPTATVIIDNLKKYGFVQKEKDAEDGKRIQVKITELGRQQVMGAQDAFTKLTDFDPLACFSEEEKQKFEELLIKMHQHMKKIQQD
jgi:DNA-binding MarR family transcriptional regulator